MDYNGQRKDNMDQSANYVDGNDHNPTKRGPSLSSYSLETKSGRTTQVAAEIWNWKQTAFSPGSL